MLTDLFEALVDFVEDASFVEHLATVAMFVVVGDVVAQLSRQLAIDHVFFDLFELQTPSHSVPVACSTVNNIRISTDSLWRLYP